MRRRRLQIEAPPDSALVDRARTMSRPLRNADDLGPLLDRIGDARYVLLGEASHGTSEFYTWRAEISRRLIREKGFHFIAVEGDWPDCMEINRYVKHYPGPGDGAREVLGAFARWPTWMWANEEIADLAEWLRGHNAGLASECRVGFYGLDVYSLWGSMYSVMGYLRKHDPAALPAARRVFDCFAPYGEDEQAYARATRWADDICEDDVVALLTEVRRGTRARLDRTEREAAFDAEQNALVIKNAESYYRAMVRGGAGSWNVRDRHMTETLERLMRFHGPEAKGIVWEHNTHIGDARFTDMADDGMVNVGQLVREGHEREGVVLVGFSTSRGTVIAGDEWEAPMERMPVPPARAGSWEAILHQAGPEDKLLIFEDEDRTGPMAEPRGHRAIGVVYHPAAERLGNYVPTVLPRRYDALLFIDRTEALHPMPVTERQTAEPPEMYPSGV